MRWSARNNAQDCLCFPGTTGVQPLKVNTSVLPVHDTQHKADSRVAQPSPVMQPPNTYCTRSDGVWTTIRKSLGGKENQSGSP